MSFGRGYTVMPMNIFSSDTVTSLTALPASTTSSASPTTPNVQTVSPPSQTASVLASPSFSLTVTLQTSTPTEVSKSLVTSSSVTTGTLDKSLSLTTQGETSTYRELVTFRILTTSTSTSTSALVFTVSSTPKTAMSSRIQMPAILGGVAGLIILILVVAILWYRRGRQRDAEHVLHPFGVEVESEQPDSAASIPDSSIATTPPVRKETIGLNQDPQPATSNNASRYHRSRGDIETPRASPSALELLVENDLLRSEVEQLQKMLEIPSPPYSASLLV